MPKAALDRKQPPFERSGAKKGTIRDKAHSPN
jgi:hypothetical protein